MAAPISRGVGFARCGRRAGDGGLDEGADLVFAGGLGHVALDHFDLGLLLGGELWATALGEAVYRFAALFQQSRQNLGLFGVGERLTLVDLLGAQGGFDHAQGGEAMFLAGLHGGDDVRSDFLCNAHASLRAVGVLGHIHCTCWRGGRRREDCLRGEGLR